MKNNIEIIDNKICKYLNNKKIEVKIEDDTHRINYTILDDICLSNDIYDYDDGNFKINYINNTISIDPFIRLSLISRNIKFISFFTICCYKTPIILYLNNRIIDTYRLDNTELYNDNNYKILKDIIYGILTMSDKHKDYPFPLYVEKCKDFRFYIYNYLYCFIFYYYENYKRKCIDRFDLNEIIP